MLYTINIIVNTDNADAVTEDISQNFKLLNTEAKRLRDDGK